MEIFFYFTHFSFEEVRYQEVRAFLHRELESMLVLTTLRPQALTKQPRSFHPHTKRYSTSLVFREMQIRPTIRYHFICTRMARIKKI